MTEQQKKTLLAAAQMKLWLAWHDQHYRCVVRLDEGRCYGRRIEGTLVCAAHVGSKVATISADELSCPVWEESMSLDDLAKVHTGNYVPDGALLTSKSVVYMTPRGIVEQATKFFGDVPDFDPAGHPSYLYASRTVLLPEYRAEGPQGSHIVYADSLMLPWTNNGKILLNPPYGRTIGRWTAKMRKETDEGLLLVPARTDTQWFHEDLWTADALCFIEGRITFPNPLLEDEDKANSTPAPFPSVLAYYAPGGISIEEQLQHFKNIFGGLGHVLLQP